MAGPILSFSLGIPRGGEAEEILGIWSQDNQSPPAWITLVIIWLLFRDWRMEIKW